MKVQAPHKFISGKDGGCSVCGLGVWEKTHVADGTTETQQHEAAIRADERAKVEAEYRKRMEDIAAYVEMRIVSSPFWPISLAVFLRNIIDKLREP